ncbi:MAG TPA: hypothetical protein VI790_00485 [Candidatus Nanoarchaeia archaeon]|nr:hypothetical protein [Candidatus Nanoarchaeia archaeon]
MSELVKKLLDELMCDKSKKEFSCANRFKSYSKLLAICKAKPEEVYPYWDEISSKIFSKDNTHKFHGIDLLPELVVVDKENRIKRVIDDYILLANDDSFVIAMHVAAGLGKIAKAKPELKGKITKALLKIDYAKTKHPDLLRSAAIDSFLEYLPADKEVIDFAKKLLDSKSPKAVKKAKEFMKVINS